MVPPADNTHASSTLQFIAEHTVFQIATGAHQGECRLTALQHWTKYIAMLTDILRSVVGEARCRVFDWRHGISTCGNAKLAGLTIVGDNATYGAFYHPSHPKFLFEVFGALNIDFENYTFVDLGSGKGRALLVASEFPFREVVGVEFARELHEIACKNVRSYRISYYPLGTLLVQPFWPGCLASSSSKFTAIDRKPPP